MIDGGVTLEQGFVIGALCLILSYFIGSLNFGVIVSRKKFGEDVRKKGSGNAGATNVYRNYGAKAGALTFLGDFLKGTVSCLIGVYFLGFIGGFLAGFGCMIGHAFPCYFGFKGGKGVAVTAGSILAIDYRIFIILIICFVLVVWWTKFVSIGSVTAAFLFPLLHSRMNYGKMPAITNVIAILMGALVVYLHRGNLKRVYKGEESRFSFKRDKE